MLIFGFAITLSWSHGFPFHCLNLAYLAFKEHGSLSRHGLAAVWYVLQQIHQLVKDCSMAFPSASSNNDARMIRWSPPTHNNVKLNTNGSFLTNPCISGYGGNWLFGYSGNYGFMPSINSELQAILVGLQLVKQHGYTQVLCKSDSTLALQMIRNGVQVTPLHRW